MLKTIQNDKHASIEDYQAFIDNTLRILERE
jgi:hypothetical protein